ncbi:MAG: hypothetical protein ABIR91_02220 [Candidatus Saccharimonadales bacterium]
MHFTSANNPNRTAYQSGFTLVEMLVIAPVAMLIIAGFIALMVSMVGNVLTTRDLTKITYDAQASLNSIEQDTRLSLQFLTATTGVQSPQGIGANFTGSGNFSNSNNTLILQSLATTKNPADSGRKPVYYANQPNACGLAQEKNQLFAVTVVYFIKDTSLWRRMIIPPYNTGGATDINTVCQAPWQLRSCSPGYSASLCQTNDIELMRYVTAMSVDYYTDATATTSVSKSNSPDAKSVKVTLTGTKKVASKDVSITQSVIASKINSATENVGPTPLAVTLQPVDQTAAAGASSATFTSAVNFGNAAIQWQMSSNGGSTWTDISGATNPTLTLSGISSGMNGRKYRMVATAYGTTVTSNAATLSVTSSVWTDLSLQNLWVRFSTVYSKPGVNTSASGEVFLRGVIKSGSTARNTTLAVLPANARPAYKLIFTTTRSDGTFGRIDIFPNGEVKGIQTDSAYTSLDGIHYMPASSCSMTAMTPQFGWANYGSGFAPLESCKDSDGRVHIQGLLSTGTLTTNTVIATWPSGFAPDRSNIMPSANNEAYPSANYGWYANGIVSRFPTANEFLSIMGSHYPSAYSGWTALSLQNSWVNYNAPTSGYSNALYTKSSDGIVNLQGLIKSGTTTAGTVIGTLPSGYRPSERLMLNGTSSVGYARIDVLPTGDVVIMSGSNGWLSLSDISFVAAP